MESGVTITLSIEPKDSEVPPHSVLSDLVDQIKNSQSQLRRGKLGGFFNGASVEPIRGFDGVLAPEISELGEGSSVGSPKRPDLPAEDASGSEMAERCRSLQQRLKLKERELLDVGASQQERIKVLETLLKDREHLSQHAKEMWMKESGRASKLAEALEDAENKARSLENKLKDLSEMYNEASQEVRQLKHWFSSQDGYIPSPASQPSMKRQQSYGKPDTAPSLGGFDLPAPQRSRHESPGLSAMHHTLGRSPNPKDVFPRIAALNNPTKAYPSNSPPPAAESNQDRFRHLCLVNDAILYEDDVIQIGVKASYKDLAGEVFLFLGNKHVSGLQSFQIDLYGKDSTALKITCTSAPNALAAKQQVCQQLNITALSPFSEEPSIRIQFLLEDGTPRRMQSKLPISINKFVRPIDSLKSNEFLMLWREVEFIRNEIAAVCNVSKRFDGRLSSLVKCVTLGGALKLLVGVDPNPDNFVLAGRWPGDCPATVLMRVEVGSGVFEGKTRLACRSDSPALAQAICNQVNMQVSAISNEAC